MADAKKSALDRIIVKSNARMKEIIDWYLANKEYLEHQPFKMPFKQGLVVLEEEMIEFSFEAWSESEVIIKIYPERKDLVMVAFKYDPQQDVIVEKRWPSHLPLARLQMLKQVEEIDKTCKKEAFKYRMLMLYSAYYYNEVVVDKKQEKRLDKHSRNSLKKKGMGPVPLVRNTYVLEPSKENLKKPVDPEKKRHYEKPDHEVRVKGYRRKNGTWVSPYSRYKDKKDGKPKIYKA